MEQHLKGESMASSSRNGGRSLATEAYEIIKQEILELKRPPGQRLVERDLATELEISRIPMREALRRLESEGLIVIVPRQGAMVAPFTVSDVRHLFDVRESLEVLAARLAAQRIDTAGLQRVRTAVVDAQTALEHGDTDAATSANSEFHARIIELSGNPLLQSMMQPLHARMSWLFQLTKLDPADQCSEHESLYQAIAAGDVGLAGNIAYEHVRSGRELSLAMAASWSVADLDPIAVTKTRQRNRREDGA